MNFGWYARRLRGMSLAEVAARVQVLSLQRFWAAPRRRPDPSRSLLPGPRACTVRLARSATATSSAGQATIAAADRLLAGSWPVFHLTNTTLAEKPDWFADPLTGRRAPSDSYAFAVAYREEANVGNIKFVWELSRHQATSLLAAAWWLTGDDVYAERAAKHLISWWSENAFLHGVHWVSAIEVGIRLLSWSWIRILLSDWTGVAALFDDNPVFVRQLHQHQLYLHRFHSCGSSANNHLIAELAGLSTAATIFPWFAESAAWAEWSRARLLQQVLEQTHEDGVNREQASEYHVFVMEMLLAAMLPARMAARPFPKAMDEWLLRMADALAASLDASGRPPRFGDGDEGRGVLVDAPDADHAAVVLDACSTLFGAASWWPAMPGSVLGRLATVNADAHPAVRDVPRPEHFPDAGMTILRTGEASQEIWVRCDAGPHGFLSIAAHGHADALSIELRYGGVDVLADPGTYCYHGESSWRGYFKGTRAHNTLAIDGQDQAVSGGPFLWLTHPASALDKPIGNPACSWQARHDGYCRLADPVVHHRRVEISTDDRSVVVRDWIDAREPHEAVLSWHFGPDVSAELGGAVARLQWPGGAATLDLAPELTWSLHHGQVDPPLGWYSAGFGHKTPAYSLTGCGRLAAGTSLQTRFTPLPA